MQWALAAWDAPSVPTGREPSPSCLPQDQSCVRSKECWQRWSGAQGPAEAHHGGCEQELQRRTGRAGLRTGAPGAASLAGPLAWWGGRQGRRWGSQVGSMPLCQCRWGVSGKARAHLRWWRGGKAAASLCPCRDSLKEQFETTGSVLVRS